MISFRIIDKNTLNHPRRHKIVAVSIISRKLFHVFDSRIGINGISKS